VRKIELPIKFSTRIELPSDTLSDAVEDTSSISDALLFVAQPDKFTIKAEGNMSKANIDLIPDDKLRIKCTGTTKAKYSVDYLKKMIAGSKLSDNVELEFAESYPLKISYKVVDKLLLSFILAPRTEND